MGFSKELHRWTNHQFRTWISHALGAALFPAGCAILAVKLVGGNPFVWALLVSVIISNWFLNKEYRDRLQHKLDGTYDTPDLHGITPRMDMYGDLIGPFNVTHVYALAVILDTLV